MYENFHEQNDEKCYIINKNKTVSNCFYFQIKYSALIYIIDISKYIDVKGTIINNLHGPIFKRMTLS